MRPMPELKIYEIPISELVEYENNAKLHPHEQVDQIANSISEFGNNDPIAVWHNENGEPEIVEGHGRLMALRKLGIETAPVIYLDHLTDEQRRAYALVHNKLTMNSDFDFGILADELSALDSFDMGDFGFDMSADEVDEAIEEDKVEPELELTKSIDYASNYVVLKFTTDIDWLWAQDILGIKRVMQLSTRSDGSANGLSVAGIGRVLDGVETIQHLIGGGDED